MNSNIPPDAKLIFKSKFFEVWRWEQKMYDGSIGTFERVKRADTVVIVPVVGEKIIILDQEQPHRPLPFVSFPGGRMDMDETVPLESAKREFLEETGYTSEDWVPLWEYTPSGAIVWTVHVFVARNCKKVAEPHLDGGEKISLRLITFEEMLLLSENSSFRGREIIEQILRMRLDPVKKEEFRKLIFG